MNTGPYRPEYRGIMVLYDHMPADVRAFLRETNLDRQIFDFVKEHGLTGNTFAALIRNIRVVMGP